ERWQGWQGRPGRDRQGQPSLCRCRRRRNRAEGIRGAERLGGCARRAAPDRHPPDLRAVRPGCPPRAGGADGAGGATPAPSLTAAPPPGYRTTRWECGSRFSTVSSSSSPGRTPVSSVEKDSRPASGLATSVTLAASLSTSGGVSKTALFCLLTDPRRLTTPPRSKRVR